MSPSLRSTLRVVLCPDKVLVLGRTKGLHPAVYLQVALPCCSADHHVPWQAALQTFEFWLKENPQPNSRACFILSNRFVRYALVPWSDEISSSQEELILAQAVFGDVYGDLIESWSISIADTGYQRPKLAAAVDAELMNSLSSLCRASSLSLDFIAPWLTVAYSHFLPQIEATSGLFAVEEANQLVTLYFQDRMLTGVRRDLISETGRLPDYVQRERMYSGLGGAAPFYLHTERNDFVQTEEPVQLLHVSEEHEAFEMALTDDTRHEVNLRFYRRRLEASTSGWAVFSFSILLLVFLSFLYFDFHIEHQKMKKEILQMSAMAQQAGIQASNSEISNNLQHAAEVIEQLSFPWNKLFNALESASTKDVFLLSVQPDIQARHVALQGEAKDWRAMVSYLRSLSGQLFFTNVELVSHEVRQNDPRKPVRFDLKCTWE